MGETPMFGKVYANWYDTWKELSDGLWYNEVERKEYLNLKTNRDKIIDYLQSVAARDQDATSIKETDGFESILNWWEKRYVEEILKKIWLDKFSLSEWVPMSIIVDIMQKYINEKDNISQDTRTWLRLCKDDVVSNNEEVNNSDVSLENIKIKKAIDYNKRNLSEKQIKEISKILNLSNTIIDEKFVESVSVYQVLNNLQKDWMVWKNTLNSMGINIVPIITEQSSKPASKPTSTIIQTQTVSQTSKPNATSKIEVLNKTQTSLVFRDWAYYLTWPSWKTKRIEYTELAKNIDIPKNAPKNLESSVWLVQDFSQILDAYLVKFPNNKSQYEKSIKTIQDAFSQDDIQLWKKILDVSIAINDLDLSNGDKFDLETAFWISDLEMRHIQVLDFARKNLGQYDMIAKSIINKNSLSMWIDDSEILKWNFSWTWLW